MHSCFRDIRQEDRSLAVRGQSPNQKYEGETHWGTLVCFLLLCNPCRGIPCLDHPPSPHCRPSPPPTLLSTLLPSTSTASKSSRYHHRIFRFNRKPLPSPLLFTVSRLLTQTTTSCHLLAAVLRPSQKALEVSRLLCILLCINNSCPRNNLTSS